MAIIIEIDEIWSTDHEQATGQLLPGQQEAIECDKTKIGISVSKERSMSSSGLICADHDKEHSNLKHVVKNKQKGKSKITNLQSIKYQIERK